MLTMDEAKRLGYQISLMRTLRDVTGDDAWASSLKQGTYRLQRVEYDEKGRSTVTPVTGYLSYDDYCRELEERIGVALHVACGG